MTTSLFWEPANAGKYNSGIVTGGFDKKVFKKLYVVRAVAAGAPTPGFLRDGDKEALIPSAGKEVKAAAYETLMNPQDVFLEWIKPVGDTIPTGAVKGGLDKAGKPIFIARAKAGGDYIPGKMVPTDAADSCFVVSNGKEVKFDDFEVLCVNTVTPMPMTQ